LLGKILFLSDREGAESEYAYVYDPATGQLGRLTDSWPYHAARERDTYSADTVFQAYTKQLLWTNIRTETGNIPTEELAIHVYDYKYKAERIATRMGAGIVYDPAWSPVSNEIAFVATESGNDEIWVINADGSQPRQLTRNTWEWDKSPSWSPDGRQIVFMSNRTGNQQLWVMQADGSDPRLLMGWDNWTPYNDWAPVWVKYLDPAPPPDQER
jgi:Tol biopolymer transport system component